VPRTVSRPSTPLLAVHLRGLARPHPADLLLLAEGRSAGAAGV